jgi:death on curing protein
MREPHWLLLKTVLSLHDISLAAFGGRPGLRDGNLLESALMRARNLWSYGENPTLYQLAAAIGYGICKNHPFMDGNKRTAFLATVVFLERNGLHIRASELQVVLVMNSLAAGQISEQDFALWLGQALPASATARMKS